VAKPIFQGCIIRAKVCDPQGGNPKIRPLVVVTATEEVASTDFLVGVAVTSIFHTPLQDDEVSLPWHATGAAKTSLVKPCVAKCSWLCEIKNESVVEVKGSVPSAQMAKIIAKIKSS